MSKKIYEICPVCKGKGKLVKKKKVRTKCSECSDHGHGCFGSGRSDGLGYTHCVEYIDYEEKKVK